MKEVTITEANENTNQQLDNSTMNFIEQLWVQACHGKQLLGLT